MTTSQLQRFGLWTAVGGAAFALALTYVPADQSWWLTPVVAVSGALLGSWLLCGYARRAATAQDEAEHRDCRMGS